MTNDERDLTPESNLPSSDFVPGDDDLRYAPPVERLASTQPDSEASTEQVEADDIAAPQSIEEPAVQVAFDSLPVNVTDGLDIEAALAAVSSLSDVVAEQEAAELSRIAKIEAEAQAKAERQARMDNPERFFPVPPMTTLKRGQMTSIIPAVWLIGLGAWLTFTLTTSKVAPDTNIINLVVMLGLGITLLSRWLSSRRWATGSLFFGLVSLLVGALFFYLLQPASPGITNGWPLFMTAIGLAGLLTRFLSHPADSRLTFPSLILIIAGIAGSVMTLGLLNTNVTFIAASLWPVAIVIIVLIWVLPLVFRQRQ